MSYEKKSYLERFKYLSGIKPTGELTLGNYLGVIQPAVDLNKLGDGEVLMFIADMHAFTVPDSVINVNKYISDLIKTLKVFDLDFFVQSHIPEHNQLGYIMEYLSKDWELRNQVQYRERSGNKGTRVSLLTYPALMAADCLMYDIPYILVGEDQLTHLYLLSDLVKSFEREFGKEILNRPKPFVSDFKKIMDLRDPSKKMSKSNGDAGCITLLDDPEEAYNKIIRAVTDSDNNVEYDEEGKPGVSNLLNIYSGLSGLSIDKIEAKYEDIVFPYGDFKKDLGQIVKDFLIDFQRKFNLENDLVYRTKELEEYAEWKLSEVKKSMGLPSYVKM